MQFSLIELPWRLVLRVWKTRRRSERFDGTRLWMTKEEGIAVVNVGGKKGVDKMEAESTVRVVGGG